MLAGTRGGEKSLESPVGCRSYSGSQVRKPGKKIRCTTLEKKRGVLKVISKTSIWRCELCGGAEALEEKRRQRS